jgi:hypothetical protein
MEQLPILQHTYDLIKWYVPLLNRLPRSHKFNLGDRLIARLGDRNWKFGGDRRGIGGDRNWESGGDREALRARDTRPYRFW